MRPCTMAGRRPHGHLLIEWAVASALGLMVAGAALSVFVHQAQLLRAAILQHAQVNDRAALAQALLAELRIAGQRDQTGPSAAHDALTIDAGPDPALHYLCDVCGSPDMARRSTFRLQNRAMSHRSLGAAAHQALHDPRISGLQGWDLTQGTSVDCSPWLQARLRPTAAAALPLTVQIRPRNLGLMPCERVPLPVPSTPASGP